jgi:putative colanic acid biosynthesis acetyltransferase WcaF
LTCFGAEVSPGAHPYPTIRVWGPWNLKLGPNSCLGDRVDVYSVDRIELGEWAVVSQDAVLCTATHDYNDPAFPLVTRPIMIGPYAWVAAGAFIGPGVTVGDGAVVGARAVVMKDVPPWTVVAGNPAKPIGQRRPFLAADEVTSRLATEKNASQLGPQDGSSPLDTGRTASRPNADGSASNMGASA